MKVVNWCIHETLAEGKVIDEKRRIAPKFSPTTRTHTVCAIYPWHRGDE
jgi:hypothetical protein